MPESSSSVRSHFTARNARLSTRRSAAAAFDRGRRAGFTLLELLAVISIVATLAGIALSVGRRVNEVGRVARAKTELAALSAALESYKNQYGDYPQTDNAAALLQSLLGKRGPRGAPVDGRVLLEIAHFKITDSLDPLANPSAQLLDPWDQPYGYAYKSPAAWTNPSFVLYSAGPDGASSPLLSDGVVDHSAAANADNLYANQ